jgi:Flp pilus assembly pilin Flp
MPFDDNTFGVVQVARTINERGQSITEYAVVLALMLLLVLGVVRLLGRNVNSSFSAIADKFQQTTDQD